MPAPLTAAAPSLPARWLRLHAVALGPVRTGHALHLDLRGTLGWRLRQLACPTPGELACHTCPDDAPCVYRLAFEVPGAPGRPPPKSGQAPRPYLLRAPLDARRLQAGDAFAFDVLLLGPLAAHAPAVVAAFALAQEAGLGDVRARFRLAEVMALDLEARATAAVPHTALRRSASGLGPPLAVHVPLLAAAPSPPPADASDEVTVRFLTPTWIERRGQVERVPTLAGLIDAIGRRVRTLIEVWGDTGGMPVRWPDATGAADTVHWDGGWEGTGRRSKHQAHTEHRVEGFVGEVRYRGRLAPLLPWLRLGERLHVGSNTPFGCGWMHVLDGDRERLARVVGLDGAWPPARVVRARDVPIEPPRPAVLPPALPTPPPALVPAVPSPVPPTLAPPSAWPPGAYVLGDVLRVDRRVLDPARLDASQRAALRGFAAWLLDEL